MKKLVSYTLIALLGINILAPISMAISLSDGIQIKESRVYATDNCTIVSAVWSPGGEQSKSTFYRDGKTAANIVIKSKDCVNEPNIKISVYEADTGIYNYSDNALIDSHLSLRTITVPSDNFTIRLRLGEEKCEGGLSGGIGYDCDLYFKIWYNDNVIYNSWGGPENEGQLLYECDGLCLDNAALLGITANGTDDKPINVTADQSPVLSDVYTLLAPIGNINCISNDGLDKDGKPNCIVGNGIGYYLNAFFLLAIGLCGAIAVVMIIISAIQYMGDESVFGKTEAKGKILSAILGLLIALGSYALLNTINPDLTGKNGVTVSQVEAQIDEDTETEPDAPIYTGSGGSKLCTTGYIDIATYGSPTKINICKSIDGIPIADNLKKMIDSAKVSGIILSGSGSRTYERQVQLRKDHHCADIYNASAKTCKPPTARPGHSNHEVGGAVDFTCNGQSMVNAGGKNSLCFKWLSANASKYSFKNLSSESWHWSFNGK